jgi:citrate synthase
MRTPAKTKAAAVGKADLLTAKEACDLLAIKPATLYSYVSRGLIKPVKQADRRTSLFWHDEVKGMQVRSSARGGHGPVAATAMRWGPPVLTTGITEITDAGPRYRGHLATDLVRHPGAFENVAELLWSGVLPDSRHTWHIEPMHMDLQRALDGMGVKGDDSIRMMRVFAIAATALGGGTLVDELRSGSITRFSRQMLFAFAGCCGLLGPTARFVQPQGELPLAAHILRALGAPVDDPAVHAVNAAMIVGADHELSSATFAARVAASAGSGLHASVVAALATHRGSHLAGAGDMAEDLIRGIHSMAQLKTRIGEAEKRRERLHGFQLQLYPDGDPRARFLIELTKATAPQSKQADFAYRFIENVRDQLGLQPNIAVGMVTLSLAWGMPERAASAIWGIGRTSGWIAHVLEQRLAGFVLRPRGQFQLR